MKLDYVFDMHIAYWGKGVMWCIYIKEILSWKQEKCENMATWVFMVSNDFKCIIVAFGLGWCEVIGIRPFMVLHNAYAHIGMD